MNKLWRTKNVNTAIPEGLHPNPHVARLLWQRGISTKEDADKFFHPRLEYLHDPFLMKDMDRAVERLERAIDSRERICVYGDYDVDGITAVSLFYIFLEKIMAGPERLEYFIPNRYLDGYGLSRRGIDFAADKGVSLMVVLDCGIKANAEVLFAKQKGIDVIVCDHHLAEGEIPQAYAVLDPKREDCPYPCKHLSGCGVGLKLAWAYCLKHGLNLRENLYPLLDLAALSIASDIVPVVDENRVISYFGLMLLNTKPRPGIETLFRYANIKPYSDGNRFASAPAARGTNMPRFFDREITNNDLVFSLGPRLNAAGRVKNGHLAVKLMLCKDMESAEKIAREIDTINTERKSWDHRATEEALELIKKDEDAENKATTVVFQPSWNQGIIGIVASRLTEAYYRPTIVFTEAKTVDEDNKTLVDSGMLVGSARSVKSFDIYGAISSCGHLLEHYGGHKYAAGLTLRRENFEAFREAFDRIVRQTVKEGDEPQKEIEIDDEITLAEITPELLEDIKAFAPFGPLNLSPIFVTRGVSDTGYSRIIKEKHLKLSLTQKSPSSGQVLEGIAFQQSEYFKNLKGGQSFDICYHLEENTFNGKTSIQLNVQDMKF